MSLFKTHLCCLYYQLNKIKMAGTKHNTDERANWLTQKLNLKAKFPMLTYADLNFDFSKKQEMLVKLAVKLGKTTPKLLMMLGKN